MLRFFIVLIPVLFTVQFQAQFFTEGRESENKTSSLIEIRERAEESFTEDKKGKGSGFKQYQRWDWNMNLEVGENSELTNSSALVWKAFYEDINPTTQKSLAVSSNHGDWLEISGSSYSVPNPESSTGGYLGGVGRVNCLAFHPTDPDIIFAGTPAGGLWKTTSGGNGWLCLTDGMPAIGVSGVVVDYNDPDIIYIATGDGDGFDHVGIGVLKSLDGGNSWHSTGLTWTFSDFEYSYDLIMHPTNSNILFLASDEGLYVTYDAAVTWVKIRNYRFYDLEFKPNDPTTLYASESRFFFKLQTNIFGFYGITDSTQFTTQSGSRTRTELTVCPSNSNRIYAVCGNRNDGLYGVFLSGNSGDDWNLQMNGTNILNSSEVPSSTGSQANYDLCIISSNSNSNQILVGGVNMWKSVNTGVNWDITTFWNSVTDAANPDWVYMHSDFHNLYNESGTVYACHDGGVGKSTDFGETWTDISFGLGISQWYKIDVNEDTPNIILGGCQDIGTNRLNGSSTLEHMMGGDGMGAEYDVTNVGHVYITKQDGNLFESFNHGLNNVNITDPPGGGLFVTDFVVDPNDGDDLFYGGELNMYRSLDGGAWENMFCGYDSIVAVSQGVSNTNRLYAASFNGIVRTDNCKATNEVWTDISIGLPFGQANLSSLSVDPTDSYDLWVTFGNWSDGNKVFYSSDRGQTWTNRSGSLPNIPIYCVEYDTDADLVYIGTYLGVFYYDISISDWTYFSNGLPNVPVRDLKVIYGDNTLIAATHGRGIWVSDLFTGCPGSHDLTDLNDPSNENYTGFQIYEAASTITSTRNIVGGPGSDVNYKAGNYIVLLDGFIVESECEFKAEIGPCDGGTLPDPPAASGFVGVMPELNEVTEN